MKDLVRTFESLEDRNDRERERLRQMVQVGRRVASGSLRRVASNLSTCSVISAEDLSQSADSSFGDETPTMQRSVSEVQQLWMT